MQNQTAPFFLFLGNSDREGATSKLKAAGWEYQKKRLESRLENWQKIQELLEAASLSGVLVKLNNATYNLMAREDYQVAANRLLNRLQHVPHIVFVHESFLTGIEEAPPPSNADDEDDFFSMPSYFELPSKPVLDRVHQLIDQYGIDLVPYRRNAELSVLASAFIDQNERNLIFRLYVPSNRMWALEAEKLLQLFRDYLGKVSGLRVRQDQHSTKQGIVYEFFGEQTLDPSTLPIEFEDFSKLLDMCVADPLKATQALALRITDQSSIQEIVDRYAREARRLHIDLKHDRERKVLSIRHRMESELIEIVKDPTEWEHVNQLIDASVPSVQSVSSAVGFTPAVKTVGSRENVTVNYRPQIIQSVSGVVAQEVSGTTNFGIEASQLLQLIQLHAGDRSSELASAVYELEDVDAKQTDRLAARQRLKAFLFKIGEKATDVGIAVLQAYVEKKLGL